MYINGSFSKLFALKVFIAKKPCHQILNMVKCQDNLTICRMNCVLNKTKFKEPGVSVPCSCSFWCVSSTTFAGFGSTGPEDGLDRL